MSPRTEFKNVFNQLPEKGQISLSLNSNLKKLEKILLQENDLAAITEYLNEQKEAKKHQYNLLKQFIDNRRNQLKNTAYRHLEELNQECADYRVETFLDKEPTKINNSINEIGRNASREAMKFKSNVTNEKIVYFVETVQLHAQLNYEIFTTLSSKPDQKQNEIISSVKKIKAATEYATIPINMDINIYDRKTNKTNTIKKDIIPIKKLEESKLPAGKAFVQALKTIGTIGISGLISLAKHGHFGFHGKGYDVAHEFKRVKNKY